MMDSSVVVFLLFLSKKKKREKKVTLLRLAMITDVQERCTLQNIPFLKRVRLLLSTQMTLRLFN